MALPRKREQTATERIEALDRRAFENRGYLVPRPPLQTIEDFRDWLKIIAEIGSAGHVEIAWHYVGNKLWKDRLRNEYERLRNEAGARWNILEEAAREERRQAAVEHAQRTRIAGRNREIAEAEVRLVALKLD